VMALLTVARDWSVIRSTTMPARPPGGRPLAITQGPDGRGNFSCGGVFASVADREPDRPVAEVGDKVEAAAECFDVAGYDLE
jgi:hypothetical protein